MNVICFGDSNTYGYDPQGYFGGRYDADSRWVDILAAEPGRNVCNMGQNGRGIPSAAPAFPADTDLLIVMLGTNDLLQGCSPELAAERLERFLAAVPLDRSKILLIGHLRPWSWASGYPASSSLTIPIPSPAFVKPWLSGLASASPMPESGTSPWPMTAYTLRSRATKPLPPDFWRNSNETNFASVTLPTVADRMRWE